jgi:hypothetical protein
VKKAVEMVVVRISLKGVGKAHLQSLLRLKIQGDYICHMTEKTAIGKGY